MHDSGWGFVIRDDKGRVHLLRFASDKGMGRIIVETDATNLKSALQGNVQDLACHGVLFREADFLLLSEFLEYKVNTLFSSL